jgi:hypothetical protein
VVERGISRCRAGIRQDERAALGVHPVPEAGAVVDPARFDSGAQRQPKPIVAQHPLCSLAQGNRNCSSAITAPRANPVALAYVVGNTVG